MLLLKTLLHDEGLEIKPKDTFIPGGHQGGLICQGQLAFRHALVLRSNT